MSLTRIAPRVKPARVSTTCVLFDATLPRKSPRFGRGILASRPGYRAPFTVADAAWAAAELNAAGNDAAYDAHIEAMYMESAFMDRYELGCKQF